MNEFENLPLTEVFPESDHPVDRCPTKQGTFLFLEPASVEWHIFACTRNAFGGLLVGDPYQPASAHIAYAMEQSIQANMPYREVIYRRKRHINDTEYQCYLIVRRGTWRLLPNETPFC